MPQAPSPCHFGRQSRPISRAFKSFSELSSVSGRSAIDALFEVQTFYESQYLAQGFPITYLAFLADHSGDYISPEWAEDLWKDEGHHFVIPSGLPVASKFYPLEQ